MSALERFHWRPPGLIPNKTLGSDWPSSPSYMSKTYNHAIFFYCIYTAYCIPFSLEDYSEILLTVPGLSNHPTVLSDLSYIQGISCQCLYISNAWITFIITISCLNWFPNISVLNTPCFVTNNTKLNRLIIMNSSINLYTLSNVLKDVIKTTTMTSLV